MSLGGKLVKLLVCTPNPKSLAYGITGSLKVSFDLRSFRKAYTSDDVTVACWILPPSYGHKNLKRI